MSEKTMKLVDYTGKVNSHGEYLKILEHLEKKSKCIEYVLVDESDIRFIFINYCLI